MAYLSREDLDNFAEHILCDFVKAEHPKGHICYNVEPTRLAQFYGYSILYVTITRDGSILGQTSISEMWTSIVDQDGNDILFYLDGNTILIDERLSKNPKCYGRRNFTIAHELAHQFINRTYPEVYGCQPRVICDYRRSTKPHKEITDWREWQADALAAAILLPKEAIDEAMFFFGLGQKIKVLSKKYSENKYNQFCEMAEYFQVSKTTLAFRMEQLGLLERNYLIQEAQQRKGVA